MLRHTFYSIKNLYKNWSIYAVVALSSLFYFLLVLCRKSISGTGFMIEVDPFMWMWNLPIYLGIFTAVSMVAKSLFTSKSYTSSQTLIATKPITRTKISISKLLIMIIVGFIQILWWISFVAIISKEDTLSTEETRKLILGIFIYGLLIVLFAILINLIYAIFFQGKTLFIVSNITIIILSIFTFVNQTQIRKQAQFEPKPYLFYSLDEKQNKNPNFILDTRSKDAMAEEYWEKYNPSTYSVTSVFDIYHKMNMFSVPNSESKEEHREYIYTLQNKVMDNNNYKILIKDANGVKSWKYIIFQYDKEFYKRKEYELNELINHKAMLSTIKSHKAEYEKLSLEKQVFFIKEILRFENGLYDEETVYDMAFKNASQDTSGTGNFDYKVKREFADSYSQVFHYLNYLNKNNLKTSMNEFSIQEYLFSLPSTQRMYLINANGKNNEKNYLSIIRKKDLTNENIFPIILTSLVVVLMVVIIIKEKYEWIK